jgi:cellulose synthase/poly-beta-1,6-N-acetylglucosamine synthase-like glycosyltransferase
VLPDDMPTSKFRYIPESLGIKVLEIFTFIWYILWSFGIFYDYFVTIWHIFPVLVCFTRANLAALDPKDMIRAAEGSKV